MDDSPTDAQVCLSNGASLLQVRVARVIADLHCHYPMHLAPPGQEDAADLLGTPAERWRFVDRVRSAIVRFASRIANYRSFDSGPRVTEELLRRGGYGVALSVLYSPFDEIDVSKPYPSAPGDDYFPTLLRQLETVEAEVAGHHDLRIAHNPAELDVAVAAGKTALVHCVEGGFHLGGTPEAIDRNVTTLARRGGAYVTVAHLFWRELATNANAIPFIPDWLYRLLWRQPDVGLGELGRAAVTAMVREHVIVDVSHMSERALADTFALLDELDPAREVPVLATHGGGRFGGQDYNLADETVQAIADRGGVIGLILAEHQATDGIRTKATTTLDDSLEVLWRHVDRLHELTGSHRHTALGTDLDGFIKPTLAGLESAADLAALEEALVARYGRADGELIASGNALRLLRGYWRGA